MEAFSLVERTCKNKKCTNKFRVLPTSKQKFCCAVCAGIEVPFVSVPNYIKDYDPKGYRSVKEAEEDSDANSD